MSEADFYWIQVRRDEKQKTFFSKQSQPIWKNKILKEIFFCRNQSVWKSSMWRKIGKQIIPNSHHLLEVTLEKWFLEELKFWEGMLVLYLPVIQLIPQQGFEECFILKCGFPYCQLDCLVMTVFLVSWIKYK